MLRPATPADFGFIRSLVQSPDYALYLTDEDEAALQTYATEPESRLLIWQTDRLDQAGFALYCQVGHRSKTLELRRLALTEVGRGNGVAFVKALVDHGFDQLGAEKIWLDTSENNLRAQKVYGQVGFTLEGRLRLHDYCPPLERNFDTLLYGLLRRERS